MLLQKYGKESMFMETVNNPRASKLWRALFPHFQRLQAMSRWHVGKGEVSFWSGAAIDVQSQSNLTVREAVHSIQSVEGLLTEEQRQCLSLVDIDDHEEDKLVFTLSGNGKFSVRKYIEAIREEGNSVGWHHLVWNQANSFRVNHFLWRVFRNALPVDDNIQRNGVVLASRCACCLSPSLETIEHVLIHSELAKAVRSFFAGIVHKPVEVDSIAHLFTSWSHGASNRSQYGYTIHCVIACMLWEVWKQRCKLKFEGGVAIM